MLLVKKPLHFYLKGCAFRSNIGRGSSRTTTSKPTTSCYICKQAALGFGSPLNNHDRRTRLTSSLKSPIHMGVRARLTSTVSQDCRETSPTLTRTMALDRQRAAASDHVMFPTSSCTVWLLKWRSSVGAWGSSGLSGGRGREREGERECSETKIRNRTTTY